MPQQNTCAATCRWGGVGAVRGARGRTGCAKNRPALLQEPQPAGGGPIGGLTSGIMTTHTTPATTTRRASGSQARASAQAPASQSPRRGTAGVLGAYSGLNRNLKPHSSHLLCAQGGGGRGRRLLQHVRAVQEWSVHRHPLSPRTSRSPPSPTHTGMHAMPSTPSHCAVATGTGSPGGRCPPSLHTRRG